MNRQTALLFIAILSLCVYSCARTEAGDSYDTQPAGGQIRYDSGFGAFIEGSRTSVDFSDGGKVLWTTDDPIFVTNGRESKTLFVKEGGGTGSLLYGTGTPLTGDAFYAIYPALGASIASNVYSTAIPTVQQYVAGGFADQVFPMVAACGEDRQLAFKNVASMLRIVPAAGDFAGQTIMSVTVSANESMSGPIIVNYTPDQTPVVTCSGAKSVNLVAPAGIAFDTPIHVVVAPGTYTNLQVSLLLSNGLRTSYDAGSVEVDRSKYRTLSFSAVDRYADLSASGTANCYMLKESGSYKFKADIKGNGVTTSCGLEASTAGIASAKVLYTDGEPFVQGTYSYTDGYICFETVTGTLPIGTAIVAATDASDRILWSWLIWANRDIADVALSDGTTWLNMNIGAHYVNFNPLGFNGYYYQWGRKDPMQQAKGVGNVLDAPFSSHASLTDGSLANSIANPLTFYGSYRINGVHIADWCTFDDDVKFYDWWNVNITGDGQITAEPGKTMFDPCPDGYHVPTYAELSNMTHLEKAPGPDFGALIEQKLYFPCTSIRSAGISAGAWNNGENSRGYYYCTNPKETGDRSSRTVYRFWVTPGGNVGITDSQNSRAVALPVRCIKD